ncbi:hypothetical protein ACKU27_26900 [Sphingobium yanoikuyae]|uniref:hypothetical protein n=1 Tax=Sphingobium yanoikuyae TaxID=13690 RepID=UPI003B909A2E
MTAFATLSSNSRLHLRHDADLRDAPVSPSSKWGDARWFFDNPVPGAPSSASMLSWDLILPDGRNLLDEHHNNLLDWLRRLAWSLFASPGNNAQPLSPGSASTTSTGLRYLASWLVQNSYDKPDQLDPAALASYRDDLAYSLAEDSDGDDLSQAQANLRLRPIIALWQQRGELSAAGIAPMPQIPWGGRGAIEMAREVTARADGYTMPLPDEIAIPVLNRAADFLGQPTDDVLRLQAQCDAIDDREPTDHHTGPGTSEVYKKELRGEALKAFIFSRNPQTGEPWHDRLEIITNERGELIYPAQRFRQLLLAVRNAAAITIQAGTGMRISEICGLPAGIDDQSGLPRCVRVVPSFTGLNEIFLIRTVISKMEDTPREVDWLAGMRPKGASDLPLPVRAIIILDQLLVRYRQMLRSDRLLVQFTNLRGLPVRSASVAQIRSMSLLKGMRDFVEEWVDFTSLPDKSEHAAEDNDLVPYKNTNGRCIRSHQFRKFYANFALSVDPRLLPAVQMHFHHISQAMTEGHYWGTNLLQIEPLSTTQRQHTALLLYELATGKTLVSGRMGDQLQASIEELRIKIGVRGGGEGWRNAISLVFEYDIRLWFAPHGKCLPLVPQAMRCHQLAGTSSWLNKEPNYETREPGVCAGCASFVIDSKHRTFWEDRFLANMTAFRAAVRAGNGDTFRVIGDRAAQARALLVAIGADIGALEARVDMEAVDGRE